MLSWSSKGGQFTGLYCQGGPSKGGQLGKKDGPVKGSFISRLDLSKCQCRYSACNTLGWSVGRPKGVSVLPVLVLLSGWSKGGQLGNKGWPSERPTGVASFCPLPAMQCFRGLSDTINLSHWVVN